MYIQIIKFESWVPKMNLVANYDIIKSSKSARLAIIQLNCLVQKQIIMTKPFYHEIFKYSQ